MHLIQPIRIDKIEYKDSRIFLDIDDQFCWVELVKSTYIYISIYNEYVIQILRNIFF